MLDERGLGSVAACAAMAYRVEVLRGYTSARERLSGILAPSLDVDLWVLTRCIVYRRRMS